MMDDTNTMVVANAAQLVAAISGAACGTYTEARANPFAVRLGTATYTFKEGVTEQRARAIARNIRRTPRSAFSTPPPTPSNVSGDY